MFLYQQTYSLGSLFSFCVIILTLLKRLDGKGTFHVKQMAAFQRGPERDNVQVPTVIGKYRSLNSIPEEMTELVWLMCSPNGHNQYLVNHSPQNGSLILELLTLASTRHWIYFG